MRQVVNQSKEVSKPVNDEFPEEELEEDKPTKKLKLVVYGDSDSDND